MDTSGLLDTLCQSNHGNSPFQCGSLFSSRTWMIEDLVSVKAPWMSKSTNIQYLWIDTLRCVFFSSSWGNLSRFGGQTAGPGDSAEDAALIPPRRASRWYGGGPRWACEIRSTSWKRWWSPPTVRLSTPRWWCRISLAHPQYVERLGSLMEYFVANGHCWVKRFFWGYNRYNHMIQAACQLISISCRQGLLKLLCTPPTLAASKMLNGVYAQLSWNISLSEYMFRSAFPQCWGPRVSIVWSHTSPMGLESSGFYISSLCSSRYSA